jgi:high-affinity iron transporter
MFETALVTFREGIEAFLVVAITAMYLIKTDRKELLVSVWAGLGFAAVLSGVVAQFLGKHRNQELFEGTMAMVAAVLVASLTFYVAKNAKYFKSNIQAKMDKAHEKQGFWRYAAVFGFVVLMVAREGVEVALLLNVISFKYEMNANPMYIGAAIGTLAAGVLGFLWIRYSHLINIGKFMKVTSVFLVLFTVHLFLYGVHELGEAKVLPFVNNHYWAELTEDIVKKGFFSWVVTYGMVLIPAWFLFTAYLNSRKLAKQSA